MIVSHTCGRCGANVAPFGFGPPHGHRGDTVWACDAHRADADAWHARSYRQTLQEPARRERRATGPLDGAASDAGPDVGPLDGGG